MSIRQSLRGVFVKSFFMIFFATSYSVAFASLTCVQNAEPMYQFFEGGKSGTCVSNPIRMEIPSYKSELDLSKWSEESSVGTCREFTKSPEDLKNVELDLVSLYREGKLPLRIKLPKVGRQSPDCKQVCSLGEQPNSGYVKTYFGISISLKEWPFKGGIPKGLSMSFRAKAPWYFVTGNEVIPAACMDARPTINEFGQPLSCGSLSYGGGFGFATSTTTTEFVYVIIDVVPKEQLGNHSHCCPYRCD